LLDQPFGLGLATLVASLAALVHRGGDGIACCLPVEDGLARFTACSSSSATSRAFAKVAGVAEGVSVADELEPSSGPIGGVPVGGVPPSVRGSSAIFGGRVDSLMTRRRQRMRRNDAGKRGSCS